MPPPWSTYRAVSLKTFSMGTRPFDVPPVPWMYAPLARTLCTWSPIPPAHFDIRAQSWIVLKMPSMESSFIASRKHEEHCEFFVPALKSVGVACVA